MNSRSIHFLLATTTIVSSGIFISNGPVKAHSGDQCIEVLENEAEIAANGTSTLKLEEKYPEEYQQYVETCDPELEDSGLLTIRQIRQEARQLKREARKLARRAAREGLLDRDTALNPGILEERRSDVRRRERIMERLQKKICKNPKPEQAYACGKQKSLENGNVIPQSAVPKASNTLVAAALQFGKQITQVLVGSSPARNTLVAAIPTVIDTPARQTGLDKPGSTLMAQASSVGQWSAPINWPHIVIHAAVGPNGKVLTWTRFKMSPTINPNTGEPVPKYVLWNPPDDGGFGSFSSVPEVNTDIFCAGHAFAPSGNLLVVGGHASDVAGDGSRDINVYRFDTNSWFSYPNKMNAGRWYSTATYNSNGEAAIVGGSVTNEGDVNPVPEVWGPTGASIRTLTSASLALPVKPYVWNFLAPSGRIFNPGPPRTARALDITGTGRWSTISNNTFGNRYYGSAVMYDDGKVLIIGGSNTFYGPPTNTAEVIELFKSPTWIPVDQMQYRRRHHTASLLADGKVFVSGGTTEGSFNNTNGRVLAGEIWDPVTTQWTTVASMSVTRSYHQTAVLLPDARVLVVGGGLPTGNAGADSQGNFNAEIYSPPYLFDNNGQPATRPTISSSAPANIAYGQTFTVPTPDAESISAVNGLKLSSFTHQFDQNQRICRLTFQLQDSGNLSVTAPSDRNLCPAGHYMMFILNGNGVPSKAKIIKLS